MADEKKEPQEVVAGTREKDAKSSDKKHQKKNKRGRREDAPQDEYEQKIIDIARVTRVMAGGKRMRFRACVAIGNKTGTVGVGLAKGADVTIAVSKAVNQAKKKLIQVPTVNETIPHEVLCKFGAAKIIFKPASKGKGVIAGGAVRIVLELAGVKNVTSKILGTNNKVNNVKCTIKGLEMLKAVHKKSEKKAPEARIEKASLDVLPADTERTEEPVK